MTASLRVGMVINPTAGKNTGARIGREAATLLAAAGHDVVDLSAMDGAHALERGRAAIADHAAQNAAGSHGRAAAPSSRSYRKR